MARTRLTDDRLARLAAHGKADAFGQIYERHHQALYRYILSLVKRPEDARDVLQATMEKAFRSIAEQRERGALRAWLFRIAHNESLSFIAKRQPLIEAGQEELVAAAVHPSASVEAEQRERLQQLVTDVNGLPERQRAALVMRELSGLSFAEIAVALAITPQVARQTAYEARTALFELGEGREMDCRRVRETISAGDGRFLRGRRVRSHLKGCENCKAFGAAISTREHDFAALFPVLPAAAAAGVLKGVLVSGAIAGGSSGAGATGGAGGGLAGLGGGETSARTVALSLVITGALATALAFALLGGDSATDPVKAPLATPPVEAADTPPEEKPKPKPKQDSPPPPPAITAAAPTALAQAYGGSNAEAVLPLAGSDGTGGSTGAVAGASASSEGTRLPFSGLDAALIALAGLGLLGLGLGLRRLSHA